MTEFNTNFSYHIHLESVASWPQFYFRRLDMKSWRSQLNFGKMGKIHLIYFSNEKKFKLEQTLQEKYWFTK